MVFPVVSTLSAGRGIADNAIAGNKNCFAMLARLKRVPPEQLVRLRFRCDRLADDEWRDLFERPTGVLILFAMREHV